MGNTEYEDGWKYHGRGVIQLTGKDNYAFCGSAIKQDLLTSPELLIQPEWAVMSAGWFWNKKGLNALADSKDYTEMTKRINGGTLGLDDRIGKINNALQILGA
jgi:putative chitinase